MHEGITETLHRYCWAIDDGDADGVAACYTEDGESTSPGGTVRGRDAIRADVESKREARAARGIVRHLVTNVLLDDERNGEVPVRAIWIATVRKGDATTLFGSGWYEDTFVQDGDAWRIRRRVTHVDGT